MSIPSNGNKSNEMALFIQQSNRWMFWKFEIEYFSHKTVHFKRLRRTKENARFGKTVYLCGKNKIVCVALHWTGRFHAHKLNSRHQCSIICWLIATVFYSNQFHNWNVVKKIIYWMKRNIKKEWFSFIKTAYSCQHRLLRFELRSLV